MIEANDDRLPFANRVEAPPPPPPPSAPVGWRVAGTILFVSGLLSITGVIYGFVVGGAKGLPYVCVNLSVVAVCYGFGLGLFAASQAVKWIIILLAAVGFTFMMWVALWPPSPPLPGTPFIPAATGFLGLIGWIALLERRTTALSLTIGVVSLVASVVAYGWMIRSR